MIAGIPVVFRDRWILVVDKPAGLPTQPGREGGDSLVGRLAAELPYVALHHRLDQPASGLVLFALDTRANAPLTRGFKLGIIERSYRVVLGGECPGGRWDRPVEGQEAATRVEVLGAGHGLTAVACALETGRTHQIRVHAALAGTPVVGDRRYGGEWGRRWPRLALHAAVLALKHPVTGDRLRVESPIPEDLAALWAEATVPA